MRYIIVAGMVAVVTMLGNAAMAQQSNDSRSYQSYQPVPQGTFDSGTTGTEFTAPPGSTVTGYAFQWSRNPGTFNSETDQPTFVEHSHGRP
jgi:hypothetical protein